MKKSKLLMVAAMLFMAVMTMAATTSVSAAPKLNRKAKTITAGKKYTIRIKGIKQKNIKKVKFTTTKKKVATVKKKSRTKAVITAKKAGKATINVKITYKKKIKGKKVKKLKFRVTVKKAKNNTSSDNTTDKTENDDNTSWYDEDIEWINSYTVFDKWQDKYVEDEDKLVYGLVYAPVTVRQPEWYSEADYQNLMKELQSILKEVHITEDDNINTMTDQEKAYRIGRWMTDNIDYRVGVSVTMKDTLLNRKAQCHGFSVLYKILCNMADVECEYIYTVDNYINGQDMNHAWNIVKLGNYWYEMDITFARNLRNDSQPGVVLSDYFRPYNVIHDDREYNYLHPYYMSEEFMDSHPIDTLELPARAKTDGITFMTDEELYNLPR